MNHQADSFLLPDNAHDTRPGDAISSVKAGQLHQEKDDSFCSRGQARKSFHHAYPVTAVTDSDNLTLVMCSYSAGSIFEFAAGSSSGEIQVDSRPSLNRANFPGRTTELKKFDVAENGSQHRAPSRTRTFRSIKCNKHRVLFTVQHLKTATSAFQAYLLPAVNAFNH